MKQNNTFEDNEALSGLLQQWKVDACLPPRFNRQVWRRIEHAETRRAAAYSAWTAMRDWIVIMLPRPALAVAYIAVLLAAGAGVGWTQAQHETARVNNQLSARYVQLVDPYQTLR